MYNSVDRYVYVGVFSMMGYIFLKINNMLKEAKITVLDQVKGNFYKYNWKHETRTYGHNILYYYCYYFKTLLTIALFYQHTRTYVFCNEYNE